MSASAQMNATTPTAEDPVQPTVRLERRRTNRFCTELLVRLCWQDSTGRVFDGPGVIRNISVDGFGLECSQSLPIDQLVSVLTAAAPVECVVRHAELTSKGFLIGGQVLPPTAVDEILALTDLEPVVTHTVQREPLWSRWSYLWLVFGCLQTEWIIRKSRGLS